VAWDVFRPFPLADGVADIVLDVFAPRNPAEFHRVLRPTGRLIVVRPTRRHLAELRGRLPAMVTIDPAKEQRLHRALDPFFEAAITEQVEYPANLSRPAALDLVAMTPSVASTTPISPPGPASHRRKSGASDPPNPSGPAARTASAPSAVPTTACPVNATEHSSPPASGGITSPARRPRENAPRRRRRRSRATDGSPPRGSCPQP
jgi:hypothetical protein